MRNKLLPNLLNKHTIVTTIVGICIGLGFFLAINPEYRTWLLSDITWNFPVTSSAWNINYMVTSNKLIIWSNLDLDGVQSISIIINNNPETEILIKNPNTKDTIVEKMWPSMNKYTFPVSQLKKWDTIASFSHNGNKDDLSVGEVNVLFDDLKMTGLSISNLN